MKITTNPDKELVAKIRKQIRENDGYCPCCTERSKDTRCMCKDFIDQKCNGYCHCRLYYKEFENGDIK